MLLNIDRGYSLEPPRGGSNVEAVLTCTHNQCFEQKIRKISQFLIRNFRFYSHEICCILHGHVFVMRPVFSQRGSNNYVHWIFFIMPTFLIYTINCYHNSDVVFNVFDNVNMPM